MRCFLLDDAACASGSSSSASRYCRLDEVRVGAGVGAVEPGARRDKAGFVVVSEGLVAAGVGEVDFSEDVLVLDPEAVDFLDSGNRVSA